MSKTSRLFILILSVSLIFRLYLSTLTFHTDLIIQADWGKYIYQHGSQSFYTENNWTFSWPNHPPLTSLYYSQTYQLYRFFSLYLNRLNLHITNPSFNNFVSSYDQIVSPEIPSPLGYLLTLKLLPIIGDLLIAVIIFKLTSSLVLPTVYLLSPFSWYLSSFWGQTDQIAFALTLLSFILVSRFPLLSPLLFCLGFNLKPTSLLLIPLYLFLLFKHKSKFKPIIIGLIFSFILTLFILRQFYIGNVLDFLSTSLLPRLTDRPDRLTTNAYNLWHIFCLNTPIVPNIFIKMSSYLSFILLNLIAFKNLKTINTKNILFSLFVVSFGGWLFLTNMLDRYSFTGIVTSLILCSYYPKTLKYWILLSLIFWLNLYRMWWFPSFLEPLKSLLSYDNFIIGLPLSIVNTLLFFLYLRHQVHPNDD